MAVVALIGLAAYIAVTFGWRMWLQRRWTGDTGVRASPRTRPEWLAGVGLGFHPPYDGQSARVVGLRRRTRRGPTPLRAC